MSDGLQEEYTLQKRGMYYAAQRMRKRERKIEKKKIYVDSYAIGNFK